MLGHEAGPLPPYEELFASGQGLHRPGGGGALRARDGLRLALGGDRQHPRRDLRGRARTRRRWKRASTWSTWRALAEADRRPPGAARRLGHPAARTCARAFDAGHRQDQRRHRDPPGLRGEPCARPGARRQAREAVYRRTRELLAETYRHQRLQGAAVSRHEPPGHRRGHDGLQGRRLPRRTAGMLASAYEEYAYPVPAAGPGGAGPRRGLGRGQAGDRGGGGPVGGEPVSALGVSSMGEAMVPVTRDRRILGPSILNFDVRGQEYLPELRERLSRERLYAHQRQHPRQPVRADQADVDRPAPARAVRAHGAVPELGRLHRLHARRGAGGRLLPGQPQPALRPGPPGLVRGAAPVQPAWTAPGCRRAVPSGTVLGTVLPEAAAELGLSPRRPSSPGRTTSAPTPWAAGSPARAKPCSAWAPTCASCRCIPAAPPPARCCPSA